MEYAAKRYEVSTLFFVQRSTACFRGALTNRPKERPRVSVALILHRRSTMTMFKRFSGFFIIALMLSALGCASTSQRASTGEYIDDSWITTKVKTEIFKEPTLKVTDINVETHKSVVQLSGFVDSAATMNKAVEIARSVEGVSSVKNDMRLK
jgi:hypothetical protein